MSKDHTSQRRSRRRKRRREKGTSEASDSEAVELDSTVGRKSAEPTKWRRRRPRGRGAGKRATVRGEHSRAKPTHKASAMKVVSRSLMYVTSTKNVLVTGKPGVGKTTCIEWLLSRIGSRFGPKVNINGFVSAELRQAHGSGRGKGARIGFDLISVRSAAVKYPLARLSAASAARGRHLRTVGKYTVDVPKVESALLRLLQVSEGSSETLATVAVIDEIGKMEMFSDRFKTRVQCLMDDPSVVVLATVPIHRIAFVDSMKSRSDFVEVHNVLAHVFEDCMLRFEVRWRAPLLRRLVAAPALETVVTSLFCAPPQWTTKRFAN